MRYSKTYFDNDIMNKWRKQAGVKITINRENKDTNLRFSEMFQRKYIIECSELCNPIEAFGHNPYYDDPDFHCDTLGIEQENNYNDFRKAVTEAVNRLIWENNKEKYE